jgi:D-lactate dehydrogenase
MVSPPEKMRTIMASKKIFFYDTKPYDQQAFDEANKKFKFDIQYFNGHLHNKTACLSQGSDVVCAFVNDTVDKDVIKVLKDCHIQLIAMRSAGYNNVDLKAAYETIHVVHVPAYSPYAVAEHAAALMLSLNRKTHRAYYRTRDGNFSINGFLGFDMYAKTLGVLGTGKIGKCLIDIAFGFGMKVLAYDKYPDKQYEEERGFKYVTLDELYKESDIISLHCPLSSETYHLINEESIQLMKKGVMIINTGRGKLIKTDALIEGLKSGIIGSAGLDVYEEESEYFFEDFSNSMIDDDILARLLTFPNVLVTAHQGFFTKEALTNIANTTLENIKEYFDNGLLKNEICYKCDKGCRKKDKKRCF